MWFLQLSGWPVFLAIVGIVAIFMLALSVALTWLGSRSIVESIVIAVIVVAFLVAVVGGIAILATHSVTRPGPS